MDDEEIAAILLLAGLKNAVKFGGKPNKKAIMGKLMGKKPELRPHAKKINPMLDQIIKEISELSIEEQTSRLLELDPHALDAEVKVEEIKELPPLPNLEKHKNIVMRLAPYPSGALHIGNARMIVLNDEYVKRYKGELILFYDDTIGSPQALRDTPQAKYVLPDGYTLINEGLDWLGVKYDRVFYKSDRLTIYYDYCEKLIKDGIAYVCFCSGDEFREQYRTQQANCPHRDFSTEKNLEEWQNMLNDHYQEMQAVVRLKTGMDQRDPAFRDIILMRISEAEHPRVGIKYKIWPMLEFSWAIDDYLIGVTHILRGSDLIREDFVEDFIWEHFKWKKAEFLHYGRLHFRDMRLSKTLSRNNIQSGEYTGWDDPRTWSLQSLNKRGIKPEALKKVLLDLGMSLTSINFSANWLYAKNKDIIDELSDRYFFVEDPILVTIEEVPFLEYMAEPLVLPSKPEKGTREIKGKVRENKLEIYISLSDANNLEAGQIIRLKDLINIQVLSIDLKNNQIKAYHHSIELNREYPIIQWVPQENNVNVKVLKPDGTISEGLGEINLLSIPMKKVVQFERYGFVNPIKLEKNELFCYFTH
jgi:glutamyl-tRNA synthetase